MIERINEINELIKKELKKKEEVLNSISKFQNESFQIDKKIASLNEEKKKVEKENKDTKVNTFDNFIKVYEKGLDYFENDLVFFNDILYLVLKNHRSEKQPTEDLENFLEIERRVQDESSTI